MFNTTNRNTNPNHRNPSVHVGWLLERALKSAEELETSHMEGTGPSLAAENVNRYKYLWHVFWRRVCVCVVYMKAHVDEALRLITGVFLTSWGRVSQRTIWLVWQGILCQRFSISTSHTGFTSSHNTLPTFTWVLSIRVPALTCTVSALPAELSLQSCKTFWDSISKC